MKLRINESNETPTYCLEDASDIVVYDVPSDNAIEYMKRDPELKDYWKDLVKDTNGEIIVDRDSGEQIGHGFVYKSGDNKGFIFNINVNPSYRGHGYGKRILDDLVKKFGGYDLTVDTDNVVAVKMYKKYGFSVSDIGFFDDSGKKQYYMTLRKD